MTQSSLSIRRIAVSALLMSVALVLNTFFTIYLPLFGGKRRERGAYPAFSPCCPACCSARDTGRRSPA